MGRGNTIIRDRDNNGFPTYYIDFYTSDDENEDDDGLNDMFFDDVVSMITYEIMPLFNGGSQLNEPITYSNGWNSYFIVYHETNVFEVVTSDNETSLAIGCIPIYTENGKYNKHIFLRSSERFIRELNKYFKLRERTSAWTSAVVEYNNTQRK